MLLGKHGKYNYNEKHMDFFCEYSILKIGNNRDGGGYTRTERRYPVKTERKAAGKWMGMAAFVTLAAIAGGLTVWMWKGRPAEEAFPFHEDFFDWTVTAEVTHIGDHMLEYRTDRLDGVNPGVYRLDATFIRGFMRNPVIKSHGRTSKRAT